MKRRGWLGGLLGAVLLAACATPRAPVLPDSAGGEDFSLTGRVLVRQGERAEVLRMYWHHLAAADKVSLETSLGQTVAEIDLDDEIGRAKLADGRELSEEDDLVLARKLLGSPVPLRRFADWVRAQTPASAVVERDDQGRVLRAHESDWQLAYSGYGDFAATPDLPSLVEARRADILVRLKIEEWTRGRQP
ncbi:outer membrane lipoprotein LolB [Niveibacterium sp. SC-1]|uniref:outer membrane lipoprotein LolB n=1 Tax=Niveibacterium sp. SC-1 TaxID=3135646 RepID=UPI00311E85B7